MKKVLVIIFLSLFITHNLHSQNIEEFYVSGIVIDSESNKALEYATITLIKNNSDEITGSITDKNGKFKIQSAAGNYTLKIEFLSFQDKTILNFKLDRDIDLGTIKLSPSAENLNTVDISGKSKLSTIKLGKVVYNVEKDISSEASSAIDVLANVPSVNINSDNIPTIRGAAAKILINGRMSSMTKTLALQSLQASSIKNIEVITTPSAKYGTGINGGIINIILKKGLDQGLNGSVTATGGYENIYGGATTINYRKNKVNFYTNTSYFHRDLLGESTIENEFLTNGISTGFLNEDLNSSRKGEVLNTSIGFDYYMNDYIYLNIEGSYGKYAKDINTSNIGDYFDTNKTLTLTSEQLGFTDHTDDIYDISVTYDQYSERENENLYINITYKNDLEINNSQLFFNELFPLNSSLPDKDELILDEVLLTNLEWLVAYIFPLNKKSTLEFGSRGGLGTIHSDFENKIKSGGGFITNPNTSNILHYTENNYGAYSEYGFEHKKTSFKFGLIVEQTNVDINLETTNQKDSQDYIEFFPSVHFQFNKDEFKSFEIAYKRDIGRPNYIYLNPFEHRYSETTSYQGNLKLTSVIVNTVELSFLNEKESKFTLKPTAYFRHYNDFWQKVTVETGEVINGTPKLLTTPVNLGHISFSGIELLTNYTPNDWLEFNSTIDLRYVSQRGIYSYTDINDNITELNYDSDSFSGSANLNTQISLPLGLNFQSLIQYNFTQEAAFSKRYSYVYMNASLNKDILKKKATLTLSAKDIFDSKQTKRLRWTEDFKSLYNSQWRKPSILLSFTYRFNQSKKDKTIDIHINDDQDKN